MMIWKPSVTVAAVIERQGSRPLDKEIVRLHWLTAEELMERKPQHRSPLVQRCVEDFLAGRSFPLEVFPGDFA